MSEMVPSGIRLGIVRGISYGLFGKPQEFVPELRELGATLVRVYFYWSQIEPEPGDYTFEVVDAFLDQLNGSEEVWVTVCSSSRWATEQATDFLPPSPAKDIEAYDRFVRQLVQHCARRVHYWQCDNEPSNVGLTWAGTADSYVAQLRVMHRAVKETDPNAAVVLGGAPYTLPSSAPDSPERQFFDVLLREGRDFFDLFDLHLYGQADLILSDIEVARGMMRAFGYEKELVVGEYNAPWPNLYPDATAAMEQAMAAVFAAGAAAGGGNGQNAVGDAAVPQRSLKRSLWRGCTGRWPACRCNCRCSCAAACRSWKRSDTASIAESWSCATFSRYRRGCAAPCAGTWRQRFPVIRTRCRSWTCFSANSRCWTLRAPNSTAITHPQRHSPCWPAILPMWRA